MYVSVTPPTYRYKVSPVVNILVGTMASFPSMVKLREGASAPTRINPVFPKFLCETLGNGKVHPVGFFP